VKKQLFIIFFLLALILIAQSTNVLASEPSQVKNNNDNFKVDYSDPGFSGNQGDMDNAAYRQFKRADDKLNEIYNQIFIKYKNNKLFLRKLTEPK